jgi:transglutaminase-like putative cysteine protease
MVPNRPVVRLVAFAALACYGASRWATLISPAPTGRMLALVGLALIVAVAPLLARHIAGPGRAARLLAIALALAAALMSLPVSGVPSHLLTHWHLGAIASGFAAGVQALPRATVPYTGADPWVKATLLFGGGLLLLDGAMVLGFAPRSSGDARRAGAAAPLVALAVVPTTLLRPSHPYVSGLLLLTLIAALVWGERISSRELGGAMIALELAGVAAMLLAPVLDTHRPWLNYEAIASSLAPASGEQVDWTQRYGPLNWPRTGRELLSVKASVPDYWKAENLDGFNGDGWVAGPIGGPPLPEPSPAALSRWTHTMTVTMSGLQTGDVIAAGYALAPPTHAPVPVLPGDSAGTWVTGVDLEPGDSYTISTYTPDPTQAQLAAAGESYPAAVLPFTSILLPPATAFGPSAFQPYVAFPTFGSGGSPTVLNTQGYGSGVQFLNSSPYAAVYALARNLAGRARTPIAFVDSVLTYLSHGFTYSERPALSPYPLATFLLESRRGYCQQFAGAMALLLRMGGVPARVAVGFTPGEYDQGSHRWLVTDLDAHAWVEAWFAGYGWVSFDPTPSAAPELAGQVIHPAPGIVHALPPLKRPLPDQVTPPSRVVAAAARRAASGGVAVWLILMGAVVVGALGLLACGRLGSTDPGWLLDELALALRRTGRSSEQGLTLAKLEHRYRADPDAAGYMRTLRLARYNDACRLPTASQRRAVRWQLAQGLGALGLVRALWALPPWPPGTGPRALARPWRRAIARVRRAPDGLRVLPDWMHGRRL